MPAEDVAVAEVRAFNRFYTGRLGLLDERQLESPFTLTEMRLLYEICGRRDLTAAVLCRELRLDAGYCSRLLRRLETRGLVARDTDAADGRRSLLSPTAAGRRALAGLDRASSDQVAAMLAELPAAGRRTLVAAMAAIRRVLGGEDPAATWALRPPAPGDLGWIVHRHGALYGAEYGLDARFEALVAEIVAGFVARSDTGRERAWVAERAGEIAGAVLVVAKSAEAAQLRLLYVEPELRGQGLGRALTEAAVGFARDAGYREVVLWTNDVLHAARRLYERAGFRLVAAEPHRSFGREMVGETWALSLGGGIGPA